MHSDRVEHARIFACAGYTLQAVLLGRKWQERAWICCMNSGVREKGEEYYRKGERIHLRTIITKKSINKRAVDLCRFQPLPLLLTARQCRQGRPTHCSLAIPPLAHAWHALRGSTRHGYWKEKYDSERDIVALVRIYMCLYVRARLCVVVWSCGSVWAWEHIYIYIIHWSAASDLSLVVTTRFRARVARGAYASAPRWSGEGRKRTEMDSVWCCGSRARYMNGLGARCGKRILFHTLHMYSFSFSSSSLSTLTETKLFARPRDA